MRCAEIEPLLSDYADGLADERVRRIVEQHIQLCHACREDVLLARQLGQQLMRLALLPLGLADRAPRLRQRLEQRLLRKLRSDARTVITPTLLALILVVVSLLLMLVVSSAV